MTPKQAVPFVKWKWVGGKRPLAKGLAALTPRTIGACWESFVGGGLVGRRWPRCPHVGQRLSSSAFSLWTVNPGVVSPS